MSPISDHSTQGPGPQGPGSQGRGEEERIRWARNHDVLVRFGILLAVAVFIASSVPAPLFAATFSSFMLIFSIGSALAAGFARETLAPDHLTRWDQAAALMALSLLAKIFVDPELLRQAAGGGL